MTNLQNHRLFSLESCVAKGASQESTRALGVSLPPAPQVVSVDLRPDRPLAIKFHLIRLRRLSAIVRQWIAPKVGTGGKLDRSRSDFHLEPEKKDSRP